MRVFLLFLIAIVVGSAAGSMSSWFLVSDPQPLAVATNVAPDRAQPANAPRPLDAAPSAGETSAESSGRPSRPAGGGDSLEQQAREMERMRQREEQAQEAAAVEPPTVVPATPPSVANDATNAMPSNRPARASVAPVEPARETSQYILPVGIGLIAAIVAFLAANRLLSHDI